MANLFAIPNYIKASSPQGLRRLMFKTQLRDSMQYTFFDITYSEGFWFAWYLYSPKTQPEKTETAKDLTSPKAGE